MAIKAHFVNITVNRGPMEKVPTQVFLHEVPILKMIHGDDNIQVHGRVPVREAVEINIDGEFSRLQQRYGDHKTQAGMSNAEATYGTGVACKFEDHCRKIYSGAAAAPADPAEKINAMSKPQVVAVLEEMDVEFNPGDDVLELKSLLKAAKGIPA